MKNRINHLYDIAITSESQRSVLGTLDPLEPDTREFKYYAPGEGLILVEEDLDSDFQNPEARFELAGTVPEPASLALSCLGISGLLGARLALSGTRLTKR